MTDTTEPEADRLARLSTVRKIAAHRSSVDALARYDHLANDGYPITRDALLAVEFAAPLAEALRAMTALHAPSPQQIVTSVLVDSCLAEIDNRIGPADAEHIADRIHRTLANAGYGITVAGTK